MTGKESLLQPLLYSKKSRKKVQFDEDDNIVIYQDPEDNPFNQHFFYRAYRLLSLAVPQFLWNILRMAPILATVLCLGLFDLGSDSVSIFAGVLIGRAIMEFWCSIPIKGINMMFEFEAYKIIQQQKNVSMISYLVNENQIVVAVLSIMLFLFVLLNISILK